MSADGPIDTDELTRRLAALDPLPDPDFAARFRAAGRQIDGEVTDIVDADGQAADRAEDRAAERADGPTLLEPPSPTAGPRSRTPRVLAAAAVALVAVAIGAVAAWSPRTSSVASTDRPAPTTAPPTGSTGVEQPAPDASALAEPAATRNPLHRPFAWNSPWNLPIGRDANYLDAGIEPPSVGPMVEEAIIILTPEATPTTVRWTTTGWGSGPPRCDAIDPTRTQFDGLALPIPEGFVTRGTELGRYPGHAGAILDPDGRTIHQSQPLHTCGDGQVVSRADYPTDDLRSGDGIEGAHGGSGLSSLGGTIRLADLDQGRIDHAIKLTIDAGRYLSPIEGGFRWPAVKADSYATDPTGTCTYGGTDPALRMGALLALPPGFDPAGLKTEFGQMLGRALQDHGGYVVGDTCQDAMRVVTEWGPDGRVVDQVADRYGIDLTADPVASCDTDDPTCRYSRDLAVIATSLRVIDDNRVEQPGGSGVRRTTCAPPFADGTGGPPPASDCP